MNDGMQYEPGRAAESGDRLTEAIERALRLGEHLWIAAACWLIPDPGKSEQHLLDQESLLTAPEIGCYICEEPWSTRIAHRRCAGKGKPGPAPLFPSRS